jgi:hypothetical protein
VWVTVPILQGNAGQEGAPIDAPCNPEVGRRVAQGGADGIRDGPPLRDPPGQRGANRGRLAVVVGIRRPAG